MDWLFPLVAFAAVSSGTPGPNNLLLWSSGASFGIRRTIPHVLGTSLGLGTMALASAAGLAALVVALPGLAIAMKVAGSLYLIYLAWQITRASALNRATMAQPMSLVQAAGFQVVNPKAWVFALGAVTTFRPSDVDVVLGSVDVAVVMMVVILPTAAVWAAAGDGINRLLATERSRRIVGTALGLLVAASVALVWL